MPGRLLGYPRRSPTPSGSRSRENSTSPSPKLLPSAPAMDQLKRHSLSGIAGLGKHHGDKKDKKSPLSPASRSHGKPGIPKNHIEVNIESPPNVFFGPPANSTGVIFSGRLQIFQIVPELVLTSFQMFLYCRITARKPVAKDCQECAFKDTELKKWNFLTEPKTLKQRKDPHEFPFSHLIPGHLPASTDGRLVKIEYFLKAKAVTANKESLELVHPIKVARSLQVPADKQSLRIFPPTPIEAHLSLVPVIHPIGRFTAAFRLSHVSVPPPAKRPDLYTRWAIRKLTWKLEETERMISPACNKHAAKVGGEGRGKEYEDVRIMASDDLLEGWKTDYTAGEIDLEFPIILTGKPDRPLCDVETPTGASVRHQLVIEMVIAEEWNHSPRTGQRWSATGQARVLRCQFNLQVTERAGLGISWDEEEPPLYEDMELARPPDYENEPDIRPQPYAESSSQAVAAQSQQQQQQEDVPHPVASPPMYGINSQMSNYEGPPLDEVLEGFSLDNMRRPRPQTRTSSSRDVSSPRSLGVGSNAETADPSREPSPLPSPGPSSSAGPS